MDAAHQNLKPMSRSLKLKSSSLDSRRKESFEVLPPPSNSSSFPTDVDIAGIKPGVNPLYEYKNNRSRGITNVLDDLSD